MFAGTTRTISYYNPVTNKLLCLSVLLTKETTSIKFILAVLFFPIN